ncbi:MAG TPA: sigma factor-like helix-turn-helix DNA-binding protein [Thermoanaerobaculia bacterium]|jgi:DNA-directed RNA polymerase specialized sigma24 family protein|nr:sigma factor-like helix-turn-helix DNA-binding protein [Thermoanaerobaculia bacterium]
MTLTLEGFAPLEIAAVLGITENNVAVRANRARERLRAALVAEGGGR